MATTQRRIHVPPPSGFGPLPFSSGVMAGETFYLAGHIGIDPATRKVPQDIEAEVRLLMEGIRNTLGEVDLTLQDVVSVQIFVRTCRCSTGSMQCIVRISSSPYLRGRSLAGVRCSLERISKSKGLR